GRRRRGGRAAGRRPRRAAPARPDRHLDDTWTFGESERARSGHGQPRQGSVRGVGKKGHDMPQLSRGARELAPKVPEIALLFWLAKVLTTGMGEAMSDFMGQQSIPIAAAVGLLGFAVAMRIQLRARAYSAPVYWFAVMMVAVFGTMVA